MKSSDLGKEVIKKEVLCSLISGYKRLNQRLFTSGSIETSEIICSFRSKLRQPEYFIDSQYRIDFKMI